MENIKQLLKSYHFGSEDEANLRNLAEILMPHSERLANEFYDYLSEDTYTASFFQNETAIRRRKETLLWWLDQLVNGAYDSAYLMRLKKIGKVHVKIGLRGHHVNAAMYFIRRFCHDVLIAEVSVQGDQVRLMTTLDKVLDIHLDVLTSSYREEELRNVFLSRKVESMLIQWAQRLLHGLNLLLVVGLLAMAVGVLSLFVHDVYEAFTGQLETGVIKALGSLLILWMMIELIHAEVDHLRGGKFHVRLFLELALVAFIRKLFVAALDHADPVNFALLVAGLLVLGLVYYLMARSEPHPRA